MKLHVAHHKTAALTLVEVLVVIVVLAALVAMILPRLAAAKRRSGPTCVNNIKQIGLSFQIWAGDNNGKFPMEISVTNGGTMELAATGNVVAIFQVMSNELSTPKILLCQKDKDKTFATNFGSDFTAKSISYFVGLDANMNSPQTFLSGDDNFAIGGVSVKSGLLELSTNALITWTAARHKFFGNIGHADDYVETITTDGLQKLVQQTGVATNRLAIP